MNLQDFLNENLVDNLTDEVFISNRFRTLEGVDLLFKIRAVTGEEHNRYQKECTSIHPKTKAISFDNKRLSELIVINGTVNPNFKHAESIHAVGCNTPEEYINKTLLAGEISALQSAILTLSGFNSGMEEIRVEAKNE